MGATTASGALVMLIHNVGTPFLKESDGTKSIRSDLALRLYLPLLPRVLNPARLSTPILDLPIDTHLTHRFHLFEDRSVAGTKCNHEQHHR